MSQIFAFHVVLESREDGKANKGLMKIFLSLEEVPMNTAYKKKQQ